MLFRSVSIFLLLLGSLHAQATRYFLRSQPGSNLATLENAVGASSVTSTILRRIDFPDLNMLRRITLILFASLSLSAAQSPRDQALQLAEKASQSPPAEAAKLAEEAYRVLESSKAPEPRELASCAALAGRSHLANNEPESAIHWLSKASLLPAARSELADLHLKNGDLQIALTTLAPPADLPQWWQTKAKIELAMGLSKRAVDSFTKALSLLPPGDSQNRQVLLIDLAGANIRNNDWPTARPLLDQAAALFENVAHHPAIITACTALLSQDPELDAETRLNLLLEAESYLLDFPQFQQSDAAISFKATLAQAHSDHGEKQKAAALARLIVDRLPPSHPLRCQSLDLLAYTTADLNIAKQASSEALAWMNKQSFATADILLGVQRTVDPISPLARQPSPPLDQLTSTLWHTTNIALRKKTKHPLPPQPNSGTHILYFTFDQRAPHRVEHLAAIVYQENQRRFIDLGPSKKIYSRVTSVISSAELTLSETTSATASLNTRLTALWKSIWQPLKLRASDQVTITPGSFLQFVPWSILRSRDKRYLCQDYQSILIQPVPTLAPSKTLQLSGTAIGFTKAPDLAADLEDLPPLPGVSAEIKALPLTPSFNLPKKDLLSTLRSAPPILHISGHGIHYGDSELTAAICTVKNLLTASEISNLDLSNCLLVTLSLCRGGLGMSETGGNWSSLQRSFIAAGAQHCIAAQWKVRDDLTPEFMSDFYTSLAALKNPTKALLTTQRTWIKSGDPLKIATAGAWTCESATSH